MPLDAPDGPVTVFVDRWNDDREHWSPPGVGVVPFSQKPYWGPIPPPTVGPLVGTPEQWIHGFSYDDYINGRLPVGPRCVTVPYVSVVGKIRQEQRVGPPDVVLSLVSQTQALEGTGNLDLTFIQQAQDMPYLLPATGEVAQAQSVLDNIVVPGSTCETAALIHLGDVVTQTDRAVGEDWYYMPFTANGTYHISWIGDPGNCYGDWYQGNCVAASNILNIIVLTFCYEASISGGPDFFLFRVTVLNDGASYGFTIDEGDCP